MTRPMLTHLLLFTAAVVGVRDASGQAPDQRSRRVDSLFSSFGTSSPGCAVGVVQNGRFLHQRGYGMADLERRVPITPETVFYTGSVSKQFTAMSVALLARDGRISLDDPARKYLPEIPEAGAGITIRHMVHHLSGLREKWDLLVYSGYRDGNLVRQDDVLEMVKHQRELNFAPGDDHLYNNTAYDMLATLVERVSGQSIREFAKARIFDRLGMERSRYVDDQSVVIPDRALGYSVRDGEISQAPAYVETVGSGSVYSTVPDLARWDESFYTAALGDQELLRLVQTPGRLNDGTELTYAFGLVVERWRGLRRVQHGGALAGFRAQITRYPDQRFSAIVLCNFAQANPASFADRIAEIYLGDQLSPAPVRAAGRAFTDRGLMDRAVGVYRSARSGNVVQIVARDTLLVMQYGPIRLPLAAAGPDRASFGWSGEGSEALFEGEGAKAARVVVRGIGPRPEPFERVDPPNRAPAALAALAGRYRSAELDVEWTVVQRDTALLVRTSNGDERELVPVHADGFTLEGAAVLVDRDGRGRVRGLLVTPGRSRNIRFERVAAGR
ncbi:MAG: serine hydrolase domain-containing protein [Gemmatimonadales bacterium]